MTLITINYIKVQQSTAHHPALAWSYKRLRKRSFLSFSFYTNFLFSLCFIFFTNGLFSQVAIGNLYVVPNTKTAAINNVATVSLSSKEAFVYVGKNTLVAGLNNIDILSTKKAKNNIFYVKEKTVFYADKNEAIKVVYISTTKEVAKGEKVITTFKMPTVQHQQNKNFQLQFKSIAKHPFKVGYLGFYNNQVAIVVSNTLQFAKTTFVFKNKISTTICNASCRTIAARSNTFSYKTLKYNLRILETNFGRPPPIV